MAVCGAESQTAVHIRGRAIEVTEHEAQHRIFSGILHAAEQTGEDVVPPVAKIAAGPYASFKIDISDIQLLEYGWGNNFLHALKHANDHQSSGDPL